MSDNALPLGIIGVKFDVEMVIRKGEMYATQDHIHFYDAGLLINKFEGCLREGETVMVTFKRVKKRRFVR